MTTKKHYLYTLAFETDGQPVVFYVGHTNDPKRRETEHKSSAKDLSNKEFKYRWIRELEAINVNWTFAVVGEIDDDEDSEYEWILKFARDNRSKNISFYNDLPLTNMKAGDFYHEILHRTDIKTAADIKRYKQELQAAQFEAEVSYERGKGVLDYFNPTPRPLTNGAVIMAAYMTELGKEQREKDQAKKARAKKRADDYWAMITDPVRKKRIEEQTREMIEQMLQEIDDEDK